MPCYTPSAACVLLVVALCSLFAAPECPAQPAKQLWSINAEVVYKIVQASREDPVWKVTITGTGFLGSDKPVRLQLENWGEWQDEDGYYLRDLVAKPAVKRDSGKPGKFVLDPPSEWNGTFEVTYSIPLAHVGSAVHKRHGLLPCWNEHAACAFSINTLMHVEPGNRVVRRTAHIVPPDGLFVASGWGGITLGEQRSPILGPTNEMDNAPILIGKPTGQHVEKQGNVLYEAAQFGTGHNRTAEVLQVAKAVMPLYERHSGFTSGQPVRVFLFEGTPGATNTRMAFVASYNPAQKSLTPSVKHIFAHELFHRWLGTSDFVQANESIVWFHEGFTDCLSLWHCAASGVVERDYFASRMAAIDAEARRSPACGKIAFAQDGVAWRAGANERYSYRGGAVLAFLMDVELRKQGRPGVMQLIADLGARKTKEAVRLADIRDWMQHHGLGGMYKTCVEGKELRPLENTLVAVGFTPRETPVKLTYFGIRTEKDRIVELDPVGPAAKAGFKLEDRIVGRYPGSRSERVRIEESISTKFRYGLETTEPGVEGTYLDVVRGKEEMAIRIQPTLIQGGCRSQIEMSPFCHR